MKHTSFFRRTIALFLCAVSISLGMPIDTQAAPERKPDGTLFDAQYYSDTYADLKKAFGNDEAALWRHYEIFGRRENRKTCANPVNFDPVFYSNTYADLKKAFGNDAAKLWKHYITYGEKEKRKPCANYKEGMNVVYTPPAPVVPPGPVPKGKRIAFVGDSITTFSGSIVAGYATFYPHGNVDQVSEKWWHRVVTKGGYQLAVNASWSGSKVTGNINDTSGFVACSEARIQTVVRSQPNIVVILMGANDFMQHVPVGTYSGAEGAKPAYPGQFAFAYYTMVKRLKESLPGSKIVCCTMIPNYAIWKNEDGLVTEDYNRIIRAIASDLGVTLIDTAACGLAQSDYNDGVHPNERGEAIISDYVLPRLPSVD